jgi:hypothetical protein
LDLNISEQLEPIDGPQPQQTHRARPAVHAERDLLERWSLQIAQDKNFSVVGL